MRDNRSASCFARTAAWSTRFLKDEQRECRSARAAQGACCRRGRALPGLRGGGRGSALAARRSRKGAGPQGLSSGAGALTLARVSLARAEEHGGDGPGLRGAGVHHHRVRDARAPSLAALGGRAGCGGLWANPLRHDRLAGAWITLTTALPSRGTDKVSFYLYAVCVANLGCNSTSLSRAALGLMATSLALALVGTILNTVAAMTKSSVGVAAIAVWGVYWVLSLAAWAYVSSQIGADGGFGAITVGGTAKWSYGFAFAIIGTWLSVGVIVLSAMGNKEQSDEGTYGAGTPQGNPAAPAAMQKA